MMFGIRQVGKAVLVIAAVALLSGVVMMLWNAVLPMAFAGARPLDYPHAVGLLALSRILFGGFHGRGGRRHEHRHWQRWQAMTAEEREQFQRDMPSGRHSCGHGRRNRSEGLGGQPGDRSAEPSEPHA